MELPLFLLNTVLFPHATLPLHIFEERYKQMIGQCLEEHAPFGGEVATSTWNLPELSSVFFKTGVVSCHL